MDENIEHKLDQKERLINFYKNNKNKIFIIIGIFIILLSLFSYLNYNNEKKNIVISERYIQAGLFLASDDKTNATLIYEKIIESKNDFYSILALNTIIEKNLILDKNKILNYFDLLENSISSKENADLIRFKKALFLIKKSDRKKGKQILEELINKDSSLKIISQEIIKD
tara:strand:- start:2121 stop:2630 length:510 start_codon:yes stop_codon:yes gene_type:complete